MTDLDLDPGIRRTVLLVRSWGFVTTDSGDGYSKPEDARFLEFPHVAIVVPKADLASESDRLRVKIEELGLEVMADAAEDFSDFVTGIRITAQYCPVDQAPLIMLTGLHDKLLPDNSSIRN